MNDVIINEDNTRSGSDGRLCPLLRAPCVRERCVWWTRDWHEEKNRYQLDCAIPLIALGVNDESLLRLKNRRPV